MTTLSIGKLAKVSHTGIETIRFYERRGLLPSPPRSAAGYRRYPTATVQRLQFIHRAKALGFTLDEITDLLALQQDTTRNHSRAEVKAISEAKLARIEEKIRHLEGMRAALAQLVSACSGEGPVQGCPIIEALAEGEPSTAPKHACLG